MLLIPCPYCGPRPEIEFTYGGEAHIARPPTRPRSPTRHGPSSSTCAPTRRACTPSAGGTLHGCGRFFNALRDTVSDTFLATYKIGEQRPDARTVGRQPHERALPHRAGRAHRSRPSAALQLRRPRLCRACRRHAGLGAARQRRASGRPLVQVSPAARHPGAPARTSRTRWSASARRGAHTPNLRATQVELYDGLRRDEPEPLAVARASISARSTTCSRRFLPAGFYYKTFMWPRGGLGAALRAAHPRAAGLGRAPDAGRPRPLRCSRYAHCDVLVVGAGPAGLAAALAAADARRARDPVRRAGASSAARCSPTRDAAIDGQPARDWLAADGRDAGARPARRRCCRAPPRSATSPHNLIGLAERVTDHLADPDPRLPRERLWQVRAKRGGARGRRHRAAAGVPRQRPARRHAGRRGAHLRSTATACAAGHAAPSSSRRTTAPTGGARPAAARASRSPRSPIRARRPTARCRRRRAPPGIRFAAEHDVVGTTRPAAGRRASARAACRPTAIGGRRRVRCDLRADVAAAGRRACTCSRSRAASCASTRQLQAFVPGEPVEQRALGRRLPRRVRPRRGAGRRRCGGRGGGARAGFGAAAARAFAARRRVGTAACSARCRTAPSAPRAPRRSSTSRTT